MTASFRTAQVPASECLYDSWQPDDAMGARLRGEIGHGGELETLHDWLTDVASTDIACLLLALPRHRLPRPDALVKVVQSVPVEAGAPEAVLPGAAVFTDVGMAQWCDHLTPKCAHRLLETEVYPDELVTFGNPRHFIYLPRSVQMGYDRYMRDCNRVRRPKLRVEGLGRCSNAAADDADAIKAAR